MRTPVRTCLGCGAKKAQGELSRVALEQGRVVIDAARRKAGRGGYLCGPRCVEAAVKRKAFGRAFRGAAQADAAALTAELQRLGDAGGIR